MSSLIKVIFCYCNFCLSSEFFSFIVNGKVLEFKMIGFESWCCYIMRNFKKRKKKLMKIIRKRIVKV